MDLHNISKLQTPRANLLEYKGKPTRLHTWIAASRTSRTTLKVHQLCGKYFERGKKTVLYFRGHLPTSHLFLTAIQSHRAYTCFVLKPSLHLLIIIFHLQLDPSSQMSIWLCCLLHREGRGSLHFLKAKRKAIQAFFFFL